MLGTTEITPGHDVEFATGVRHIVIFGLMGRISDLILAEETRCRRWLWIPRGTLSGSPPFRNGAGTADSRLGV